jgi:hypothetical protein
MVAGIGSRARPLTDDRPKALVDVGGETILARAMRPLHAHGVTGMCSLPAIATERCVRRAPGCPSRWRSVPTHASLRPRTGVAGALRGRRRRRGALALDADVVRALARARSPRSTTRSLASEPDAPSGPTRVGHRAEKPRPQRHALWLFHRTRHREFTPAARLRTSPELAVNPGAWAADPGRACAPVRSE